jgi:hypothetical protein
MRQLAGRLPAELRQGFLEHPRNTTLRAVDVQTAEALNVAARQDP